MIKRMISVRPKAGKGPDAQQLAQDIYALVSKKYPDNNTEVYSEMFGDMGTLHFIAQFESLAALESQMAQVAADDEMQSLLAKGQTVC